MFSPLNLEKSSILVRHAHYIDCQHLIQLHCRSLHICCLWGPEVWKYLFASRPLPRKLIYSLYTPCFPHSATHHNWIGMCAPPSCGASTVLLPCVLNVHVVSVVSSEPASVSVIKCAGLLFALKVVEIEFEQDAMLAGYPGHNLEGQCLDGQLSNMVLCLKIASKNVRNIWSKSRENSFSLAHGFCRVTVTRIFALTLFSVISQGWDNAPLLWFLLSCDEKSQVRNLIFFALILREGSEAEILLSKTKRVFATVHSPGPDGLCTSC